MSTSYHVRLPKSWEEYAHQYRKAYCQRTTSGWVLFTESGPVHVSTIEEARRVAMRTDLQVIL